MKTGIKILAISAIIVVLFLGVFTLYNLPEQKESGVNIDYDIVCLQGLENISGIEHVKVNGTIWNTGQKNANNVSVTVIYTDIAHNKVVRNTPIEGAELLSGGMHYINFESKYLREFVLPKTVMDPSILIEWEEDGKLKTLTVKEGVRSTEEINVNPSLTIIENVELSEDEKVKLSNLIENIPEEVKQEFNTKYRAWNETWDEPC